MHGKFKRDAARVPDPFFHPRGELDVVTVAGREVVAGLRYADHRLSGLQFRASDAVVVEALEVHCRFAGLAPIVEPDLAA